MSDESLRLRTLGPVELTGPDSGVIARVSAQPRRLALLAYLAARPSGERVSRDRIVAMFWPEQPAARSRANLRNALYFLRRALGGDVIEGGEASVRVVPERLVCDASVVLERMPAPERGAAFTTVGGDDGLLDVFRGEFLDALHVSGAPDFERWVDRTRAVLRARASEIAWRLSAAAESAGEWISAARYARRAVDFAVDVEGATQRLMRLLDRAGDRAAALVEYERLASWLGREFEITPSPETTSLIDRIRDRSAVEVRGSAVGATGERPDRPRSLAVLPFEDLTGGSGTYLAAGMVEDLLTALSRIRRIRVVSRTSVRRFADQPPASMREVRELLGIDLVLEGSVQQQGDRVRINAQLIDAQRDAHLWAETWDRRLSDVFEIQSDVALRVARALQAELSPREHDRLRRPPTASPKAWQLYLRGREAWRNRDPRDAARAASMFRRALEMDDRFAEAWVGLADAWLVRAATGALSIAESTKIAKDAIRRALECDPDLGEARATLGLIATFFEPDVVTAGREYRRAVELSPGYATAHQWYGNWLCALGRIEQGLAELALAIDLDPLAPAMNDSLSLGLYHAGRIDDAEATCRQTLDLDPGFWRTHVSLALCHAARDDLAAAAAQLVNVWTAGGYGTEPSEAREAARRLEIHPEDALAHMLEAARSRLRRVPGIRVLEIVLLMLLRRHDDALAALEAARDDQSVGFTLMYAPVLDPLARHDRFRHLMHDSGMWLPRWR